MLLFKNISYLICDPFKVEQDVDLLIEGNKVARIGTIDLRDYGQKLKILDGRGKIVMPGLVNAHTHLWQSLLKGRRDDLPLVPWCEEVIFPFIQVLHERGRLDGSREVSYLWSMLGALEMVRSGITSVIDMDLGYQANLIPQAWFDLGMRGVIAIEMADEWVPEQDSSAIEQEKENVLGLIEHWHRPWEKDNLIQVALGPSAPFTCSETLLAWVKDQAEKYGLGVQIHVSETRWEVEQALLTWRKYPLEFLETTGLLSCPVTAVHCVHLTQKEIDLAKRYGVIPVYNPKSNMKLGSGVAPVKEMLEAGLEIALATDGAASNDLLDSFEEMRAGAMLQKVSHEDPSILSARDMLRMATFGGAKACRIDAGIVAPGKLADLVMLNPSSPHFSHFGPDIVPALVYCAKASDVETVVINGELVMQDKRFVTIEEDLLYKEIVKAGRFYAN
jgi:5-methylthioadenosine/S-adenosylhomocysteine deaminase